MSTEPKQEYTGTWIPAYIMLDKDLKPITKMAYAEIASFKTFTGSNRWLAERLGVSERSLKDRLRILKEKGYVVEVSFDGRRRCLAAGQNLPTSQAEFAYKNKDKNKEESPTDVAQSATPPALALPTTFSVDGQSPQAGDHTPAPAAPLSTPEPPSTNALHYRVIKKYGLPVSNHLHVKAKSKALDAEIGEEAAQAYLQRLLDFDYRSLQGEYKPELYHSRDIYDKRISINRFLDSRELRPAPTQQTKTPVELAQERERQRAAKGGWGF